MTTTYKYDVAISYAEEDDAIALAITAALKTKKVTCYYYKENTALHWGENLFKISYDTYARHSRYVLLLISKAYVEKKWTDIERQIAQLGNRGGMINILPVKIEDVAVDGLSSNIVFLYWKDNPGEIAGFIQQKLAAKKRRRAVKYLGIVLMIALLAVTASVYIKKQVGTTAVKSTSHPSTEKEVVNSKSSFFYEGRVLDEENNESLPNAKININNTTYVSDIRGNFNIHLDSNLLNGVSVEVSCEGYVKQNFQIYESKAERIYLKKKTL